MAQTQTDFSEMVSIHMKANQLAVQHRPKLPSGEDMLHLYKPMHFTKKRLGNVRIKTRNSESEQPHCLDVVNMRYAFLLGLKPMRVQFPPGVKFNWLYKGNDVLTSDTPVEIYQQYISFSKAKGHVLVGGLGLGMCAEMLLKLPAVKSVTVVENNEDVIRLVAPQIDKRIHIIKRDLWEFLQQPFAHDAPFDSAYYDIWYSCGESAWVTYVVPLYRMSQKLGIKNLSAWGEYEMHAQLVPALYVRTMNKVYGKDWKPYKVFTDACIKKFGYGLPYPDEQMPEIGKLITLYTTKVGTALWEKTFDWGPIERPTEED